MRLRLSLRWRSAAALVIAVLSTRVTAASTGPTLTIDATVSSRHPISPYIYGANYADEATAQALGSLRSTALGATPAPAITGRAMPRMRPLIISSKAWGTL